MLLRIFRARGFAALAALMVVALCRGARAEEAAVAADGGADAGAALGVNGLFPLWHQTAVLHPRGGGQVGYNHAQLGLGRVQVGTQPFLDLYRTANAQLKVALWQGERHRTALTAGVYRLPRAAEDAFIGELHAPAFSNPYGPQYLFPLALAYSFAATPRVAVHTATTLLLRLADDPRDRGISLGKTLLVDFRVSARWATRLHGGLCGVGMDAEGHVGLSFAYTGEHVLLQAGYARTLSAGGGHGGVLLLDGGLLF